MRGSTPSGIACSLLLGLAALLCVTPARAHGDFPEPRQILLPPDRPEQIILATNFGLIFSDDGGATWLFSCERELSAYAAPYLLGPPPSNRIFAMTSGAGVIHSDDGACTWQAAGGVLTDVMPYAFTVAPSNSARVYAIGAPREDLRAGDGIYVSDDEGLTFGGPVFTAPAGSLLMTVLVAPSQPSTLFAAMFTAPENHPILLRSRDSGERWEVAADLVDSLGNNPFELLAIDPSDENKLYVRVLGQSAETLAISEDGGQSFVESVSIPGKLNAFLKLASGTMLVGGTAGTDAFAYRSVDGAQSFEPWPGAPHVHALAERNGKLYVAADNFADGYVIAESDDEGASLRPLTGFEQVQAVESCVADACAESCAYYAGINLWPEAVCGEGSEPPAPGDPADAGEEASPRSSRGGCGCDLAGNRPADYWTALLVVVAMAVAGRRPRVAALGANGAARSTSSPRAMVRSNSP